MLENPFAERVARLAANISEDAEAVMPQVVKSIKETDPDMTECMVWGHSMETIGSLVSRLALHSVPKAEILRILDMTIEHMHEEAQAKRKARKELPKEG